jgi:hypothetical protein
MKYLAGLAVFLGLTSTAPTATIAYNNPTDSVDQNYNGSLGMDFDVNSEILITALGAYLYRHELMGRDYDKIQIVTIGDMLQHSKGLDMPLSVEVLKKAAQREVLGVQLELDVA